MNYIKDVLLIIFFIGLVQVFMQRDMRSGDAPDLPVKTINDMDSAILMAKKPAIIYFWGSWCGICATIQGSISAVLQDYSGITIALRSGENADVLNYLQSNKLEWPVINDNDGALAQEFGVKTVPAVFFIGTNGEISFISLGYVTELGLRLRLWWLEVDFRPA